MLDNNLSTILIIIGIALSLVVLIATLWTTLSKKATNDQIQKANTWIKSISVIAACLALCAVGAIINVLNLNISIRGNNNTLNTTINLNTSEGNIASAPDSVLIGQWGQCTLKYL